MSDLQFHEFGMIKGRQRATMSHRENRLFVAKAPTKLILARNCSIVLPRDVLFNPENVLDGREDLEEFVRPQETNPYDFDVVEGVTLGFAGETVRGYFDGYWYMDGPAILHTIAASVLKAEVSH